MVVLLGFDPGGINGFGWAMLEINSEGTGPRLVTGIVSTAPDAVNAAKNAASSVPDGIGIDAPLYWVDRGDRAADIHIRRRVIAVGGVPGNVNSVNSLRGACLVQGIITARLCSNFWPHALLTEAHPKALLRLSISAEKFVGAHVSPTAQEHERDAALAAYAAWYGTMADLQWHDLVHEEVDPFFPSGHAATYWFPSERT